MGFVFISYSRKDTNTVDDIATRLKNDGFEVWIDRSNIKGGQLWTVAIVEAIDTADSFVLMLSPSATASDNVRKEVQLAQDAKRALFPLLIRQVVLPPQFRYQLAGIQIIDYTEDPQEKYAELVEVLHANREKLSTIQKPETRHAELVISSGDLSKFGTVEKEKLLNTIANIAETEQAGLRVAGVFAGSLHVTIEMPIHAAYVLKTAALNRDKRLLKHGIDALRLNDEENFVNVGKGEIGPLHLPKQDHPFIKRFFSIIIGIAILGGGLFFSLPTIQQALNPPPPAPELVSPLQDEEVYCDGNPVFLDWNEPYDENGIGAYQLQLNIDDNGWNEIITTEVGPSTTELEITGKVITYCEHWMNWQVRAKDARGSDWGDWSQNPVFFARNTPPPAPEIVSPLQDEEVYCDGDPAFLDWNEPYDNHGIGAYQVQLNVDDNGWNEIFTTEVDRGVTELDITEQVMTFCGHWMSWQVRARDAQGSDWGVWSQNPVFFARNTPPPAPEIVSPLQEEVVYCDGNPVFLDWNEPYDENGIGAYQVQLNVDDNGWNEIFTTEVDPGVTELDITGDVIAHCERWMSWQVRARDAQGSDWGVWSQNPAFFVQNVPPPAPEIVSPLQEEVVYCDGNPVFLDWNEPYDENGIGAYQVQLNVDENDWNEIFTTEVDPGVTELDITGDVIAHCERWMSWQVRARGTQEDNWGEWSQNPAFFVQNTPPPAPQTSIPNGFISCDFPDPLVWSESFDVNGIAGYEVELNININDQWNYFYSQQVDGETTQLNISKVIYNDCDHLLEWHVRAIDGMGAQGDWSKSLRFWANNPAPASPVLNVSPRQSWNGKIQCDTTSNPPLAQLIWNTPYDTSGISTYRIQLNVYTDNWILVFEKDLDSSQNSLDITSELSAYCRPSGFHFVAKIVAIDNHGKWSDWSSWLDFWSEPKPIG